MNICQATIEELPDIFKIEQNSQENGWTYAMLKDCLLNKNYFFWVIRLEKAPIGFIIFQIYSNECHIHNIAIEKKHHQQGLGTTLVTSVLDFAKQQKATDIFLEVRCNNQPAIGLYKKIGFKEIGARKNYYNTPSGFVDAIVLKLVNE